MNENAEAVAGDFFLQRAVESFQVTILIRRPRMNMPVCYAVSNHAIGEVKTELRSVVGLDVLYMKRKIC